MKVPLLDSREHAKASMVPGFTLLEILLALTAGSIVLVYASFYAFSLGSIWFNRGGSNFFDHHVDGVLLFLNGALEEAETINEEASQPITWSRPPGYSEFDDPLLSFRLRESPALLVREGTSLPNVICYFYFLPTDGMALLWHSLLEETDDIDEVRHTVLSPFITEVSYCYYDPEKNSWTIEQRQEEDEDGQFLLPDFLALKFDYQDETREGYLYLPKVGQNVPLY